MRGCSTHMVVLQQVNLSSRRCSSCVQRPRSGGGSSEAGDETITLEQAGGGGCRQPGTPACGLITTRPPGTLNFVRTLNSLPDTLTQHGRDVTSTLGCSDEAGCGILHSVNSLRESPWDTSGCSFSSNRPKCARNSQIH